MYVFDDEDNAPMNDDFMGMHNPTVYLSRAEMKAMEEPVPFEEYPEDGCWNCLNFDWKHEACTLGWNNMDESYYNPACDDRELTDYCDEHETDPDADPECLMIGGNEP